MKKILSLLLAASAWAAMGQPTYHGTFIGNGAGLTNLQGLVLPSYVLTNGQLGTVDFQGPFNVSNTSSFFSGVVATGNSSVALSLTGDTQGDYIAFLQNSSGSATISVDALADLELSSGTLGLNTGSIHLGTGSIVMGGGEINATGFNNNAAYGTTNNGVGFFGNGAGLTNLTMPGDVLTNGQLGTVMLQGPLYNTNAIFLTGSTGAGIVFSNAAQGLQGWITNDSVHSTLTIEGGSLVTIYAGSSGTLSGGDWNVQNPYSFNVPGGDVSAHLGFSSAAGNLAGPTVITVTGSPFTYTATGVVNMIVYISGGIVTAISINGTSIGSGLTLTSLTTIPLQAGETVTVAYSSAPTMYYKQL